VTGKVVSSVGPQVLNTEMILWTIHGTWSFLGSSSNFSSPLLVYPNKGHAFTVNATGTKKI